MSDETKNLEGQSFRNEALTGSGSITSDGTYADPLPDPTEVRGISERRTSGGRLIAEPPSSEVADALNPDKAKQSTPAAKAAPAKQTRANS